jgi:hypothetical protein
MTVVESNKGSSQFIALQPCLSTLDTSMLQVRRQPRMCDVDRTVETVNRDTKAHAGPDQIKIRSAGSLTSDLSTASGVRPFFF